MLFRSPQKVLRTSRGPRVVGPISPPIWAAPCVLASHSPIAPSQRVVNVLEALMDDGPRRYRLRDFLIGGALGAFAALAAVRRRRPPEHTITVGLTAFEDAPCYREAVESERPARSRD